MTNPKIMEVALKTIHTWACCDHLSREDRREAMLMIADKAAEGLGRGDLMRTKRTKVARQRPGTKV